MTIKYGPNGSTKWVQRYDVPAGGADAAWAIAINGNGVCLTGSSQGRGTDTDYATIGYFRNKSKGSLCVALGAPFCCSSVSTARANPGPKQGSFCVGSRAFGRCAIAR